MPINCSNDRILFRVIAIAIVAAFLAGGISWAIPSDPILPKQTTLAPESRLKPFFKANRLDFKNAWQVYSAAVELRNLLMTREARDGDIERLKQQFTSDDLEIVKDGGMDRYLASYHLDGGRECRYVVFNFKKEKRQIKAVFPKAPETLKEDELLELGIRTPEDKAYFNGVYGLKWVWFVAGSDPEGAGPKTDSSLIGKWMPVSNIDFIEEEGCILFMAYDITDPGRKEIKIRVSAKRAPPGTFDNPLEIGIKEIDERVSEANSKINHDRRFILEPNQYGIDGIGIPQGSGFAETLALVEPLAQNRLARFHELAHASSLTADDIIPHIEGGRQALDDYIRGEGREYRQISGMRLHYALRLLQGQRRPEEDTELHALIKQLEFKQAAGVAPNGPSPDITHAENLKYTPRLPKKTVLCHIAAPSILPDGQRDVLNRLDSGMRGAEYIEKMLELKTGGSSDFIEQVKDTIERAQKTYKEVYGEDYANYTFKFDAACPSLELVARVQSELGLSALAFAPEGNGEMIHVENIMLALRALQRSIETGNIKDLIDAYSFVTGNVIKNRDSPRSHDITNLGDSPYFYIAEFARTMVFTMPKADVDNLARVNYLIEENIKAAA